MSIKNLKKTVYYKVRDLCRKENQDSILRIACFMPDWTRKVTFVMTCWKNHYCKRLLQVTWSGKGSITSKVLLKKRCVILRPDNAKTHSAKQIPGKMSWLGCEVSSILIRLKSLRFSFVSITGIFHKLKNIQKQRSEKLLSDIFPEKIAGLFRRRLENLLYCWTAVIEIKAISVLMIIFYEKHLHTHTRAHARTHTHTHTHQIFCNINSNMVSFLSNENFIMVT